MAAGFWYITSCVCCDVTILQWQWLWDLKLHISTAVHLQITWLWLSESITLSTSIISSSSIVFHFLATTHSHISMAVITLPRPTMDRSASDHAHALCDFQQLHEMCFTVNQTADALQHNYIMLWLGSEGLRLSACGVWQPTSSMTPRTSGTDWLS